MVHSVTRGTLLTEATPGDTVLKFNAQLCGEYLSLRDSDHYNLFSRKSSGFVQLPEGFNSLATAKYYNGGGNN